METKTQEYLERVAGSTKANVLEPSVAVPEVTRAVLGATKAASEIGQLRALWVEVQGVETDEALLGRLEELNQRLGGLYREADRLADQARKVGRALMELQKAGDRVYSEEMGG